MNDLSLAAMFLMFMAVGCLSPFVWSLGYVWVDVLLPHRLSYSLLNSVPVSLIMGAGAVGAYLLKDRRDPPRFTALQVMCVVLAAWITLTSTWAVAPDQAWYKWDTSYKTMLFTAFMPFVFRSRVQIEAFMLVFAMSASAHLLPWGMKTLLTGGGYGQSLGLMSSNSAPIAESSAIAAVTVMFVPLLWWARSHSLLVPGRTLRTVVASGMTVFYLIANVGTFARTGIIALGLLGSVMLLRSRRKILYLCMAAAAGAVIFQVTSDKWTQRISTISNFEQESSANTRLLVWSWTLDFVKSHPLGGGFNAYVVNRLQHGFLPNGEPDYEYARAFHNIYFAALGEHGYPGLLMYVSTLGMALWSMQRIIRVTKSRPDLLWAGDLARAVQLGLGILLACGNFIDISFSFLIWNMVALTMCISAHVNHVLNPKVVVDPRSRLAGLVPVGGAVPGSR